MRGVVTTPAGAPAAVEVWVEGIDHAVRTDPEHGDYYRPLLAGDYVLYVLDAVTGEPITRQVTVPEAAAAMVELDFVLPCNSAWACGEGLHCVAGECVDTCVPDCEGRSCGTNGCGGICGLCAIGTTCEGGTCEPICVPPCGEPDAGPDAQPDSAPDAEPDAEADVVLVVPDSGPEEVMDDTGKASFDSGLGTPDAALDVALDVQPETASGEPDTQASEVAADLQAVAEAAPAAADSGCGAGSRSPRGWLALALLAALAAFRRRFSAFRARSFSSRSVPT